MTPSSAGGNEHMATRAFPPALAGVGALSWLTWLIAGVAPMVLLALVGNFGQALTAGAVVAASAAITAVVVLVPGTLILPRLSTPSTRQIVVIAVFVIASVAAAASTVTIMSGANPTDSVGFEQVIAGAIFHTWFFVAVAVLVHDRIEFHEQIRVLQSVRAQIDVVAGWREVNLDSTIEQERTRIHQRLSTARARILAAIESRSDIAGPTDDIISTLLTEIDEWTVVEPSIPDPRTLKVEQRRTVRQVVGSTLLPHNSLIVPATLFMATTWVVTGITMSNVWVVIGSSLAGGLSLAGALWLLTALDRRWLSRVPVVVRSTFTIVGWFVSGVVAGIAPLAIAGLPSAALVSIGVQTTLVIALISLTLAYRRVGFAVRDRIAEHNARLEREVVENAAVVRVFREKLRHFIHADVQSVLVAAERKLSREPRVSDDEARLIVQEISDVMVSLDEHVSDTANAVDPQKTVAALRTMWGDSLAIHDTWTPEAQRELRDNAVSQSILGEMVIEIITNAAKHDLATDISLTIGLDDEDTFIVTAIARGPLHTRAHVSHVTARGSGRGLRSTTPRGRGTVMYSEVCLDWSITRSRGETVVRARIPSVHGHPFEAVRRDGAR